MSCNDKTPITAIIENVLSHEGDKLMRNRKEFSKYGIRNFLLIEYNNKNLKNYTINSLTKAQAIEISLYLLHKYRIDEIESCNLKLVLFDTYFNTGYGNASNIVQKSINRYYKNNYILVDGVMGTNTIEILNSIGEDPLFYEAFFKERLAYYRQLKEWKKYGNGWKKRIESYSTVDKIALITKDYSHLPIEKKKFIEKINTIPLEETLPERKFYINYLLLGKVVYIHYLNIFVGNNIVKMSSYLPKNSMLDKMSS